MTIKLWAADPFEAEACRAALAKFIDAEVVSDLAGCTGPLLVCATCPEDVEGRGLATVTGPVALVEVSFEPEEWHESVQLLIAGAHFTAGLDAS